MAYALIITKRAEKNLDKIPENYRLRISKVFHDICVEPYSGKALSGDRKIFLATQHDATVDEPKSTEIYQVGTIVNIVQSLKLPDGNIKVLVEGMERGKIQSVTDQDGYFRAVVRTAKYTVEVTPIIETAMQRATSLFEQYVKLCQSLNYETMIAAVRMEDPAKLTDTIAARSGRSSAAPISIGNTGQSLCPASVTFMPRY